MDKEISRRLHKDWWGKCRTCRFWGGTDNGDGSDTGLSTSNAPRWNDGPCLNESSDLFKQETTTDGYCGKWDSFDIDIAFGLLDESEKDQKK